MEKSTADFTKFIKGLLIYIIICFNISAYASEEDFKHLTVIPSQEYFFTSTDSFFSLNIQNVLPDDITVISEENEENVSLISMKKEPFSLESENETEVITGSRISLWYKFSKEGTYKLKPLKIRYGKKTYNIPFNDVIVYENPRVVLPKIIISFDNEEYNNKNYLSVEAGTHLYFTLNVKYAVQIVGIDWNIPEDSLFKEIERYEITEGNPRGNEFNPESIPVIKFDWQPLKKGQYHIPDIILQATSYSGARLEISCPDIEFNILDAKDNGAENEDKSLFAYAFVEPYNNQDDNSSKEKDFDINDLLELRLKERKAFPFQKKAYNDRVAFEKVNGITDDYREESIPLLMLLAFISIILFIVFLLSIILKKYYSAIGFGTFFIILAVLSILFVFRLNSLHGLYKGGEISPIPEYGVSSGVHVKKGSTVKIKTKAGKWLYICYNETYGWVPEDSILIIK